MPNFAENRTVIMPTPEPSKAFLAEQWGPALAGASAGATIFWIPALWLLQADWRNLLLDKTIDVEIGLLAGLVAIVAFLPAIEEKTVIRKFKQRGLYKYLVRYLKEAVLVSAFSMSLSLAMVVAPESWRSSIPTNRILSSFWWGLLVYSMGAAARIVNLAIKSLSAE